MDLLSLLVGTGCGAAVSFAIAAWQNYKTTESEERLMHQIEATKSQVLKQGDAINESSGARSEIETQLWLAMDDLTRRIGEGNAVKGMKISIKNEEREHLISGAKGLLSTYDREATVESLEERLAEMAIVWSRDAGLGEEYTAIYRESKSDRRELRRVKFALTHILIGQLQFNGGDEEASRASLTAAFSFIPTEVLDQIFRIIEREQGARNVEVLKNWVAGM